jgi:uncharacterized protein (TIGR02598 family)
VTLSIGIVAYAFVAIFALLPTGMSVFRQSINNVITSQIAQRVTNDCQQTDFTTLIAYSGTNPNGSMPPRYFDDQANELTSSTSAIYWVNTVITPATTLPAGSVNTNLATVNVQVANNPGHQALAVSNNLWTGAYASAPSNTSAVTIATYSALVSKNQ